MTLSRRSSGGGERGGGRWGEVVDEGDSVGPGFTGFYAVDGLVVVFFWCLRRRGLRFGSEIGW